VDVQGQNGTLEPNSSVGDAGCVGGGGATPIRHSAGGLRRRILISDASQLREAVLEGEPVSPPRAVSAVRAASAVLPLWVCAGFETPGGAERP